MVLFVVLVILIQALGVDAFSHFTSEYPRNSFQHRDLSLEIGEDDPSVFGNREFKNVAFYHVYAAGFTYPGIVKEQISLMKKTELLSQLDTIFYSTVGNSNITDLLFDGLEETDRKKFFHLKISTKDANEENTIKKLYHFCHHHSKANVLYFHDKGSYHTNRWNEEFRHNLNCYTLTPGCISALKKGFDTCGMRATPLPFIHYSGNFWWARCDYIKKLIDPMSFYTNETFVRLTNRLNPCVNNGLRYFAEAWVGSHPDIKPADCVDAATDHTYFYAYHFPPSFQSHCPNLDHTWGTSCGNASTLVEAQKFVQGYNNMRDTAGDLCQEDLALVNTQRSYIWYGQEPRTYLSWIKEYVKPPNLKEKSVYKTSNDRQCYWYRNGSMHAIPSVGVLVRLGYEFTDIIQIPQYQMKVIPKGEPLLEKSPAFY